MFEAIMEIPNPPGWKSRLCDDCPSRLQEMKFLEEKVREHHWTISGDSFRKSIRSGCLICGRLWNWLREKLEDEDAIIFETQQPFNLDFWNDSEAGTIGVWMKTRTCSTSLLLLYLATNDPKCISVIARNEFSSWCSAIEYWLGNCDEGHEICSGSFHNATEWYPTRLLLLDHSRTVKLLNKASTSSLHGEKYISVSHCWGSPDKQPLRLLKANIHEFELGISIEILPRTFQDAVTVAKHVGIRYLWIDSLTIIQDDQADWQQESALMDKVYTHSYCTIAATAASDSSKGLFLDKTNPERYVLDLRRADGTNLRYLLDERDAWDAHVHRAPLGKRAWVCQERLLSRRTIHFTEHQLFWECACMLATEIHPDGFEDHPTKDLDHFKKLDPRLKVSPDESANSQRLRLLEQWQTIVERYTSCELTFPSDKAIALSGIAEQHRLQSQDRYVCGMWENCLESQLLWMRFDPALRAAEYRGPSFSWLSIDARIEMPRIYNDESSVAKIQEISIELKTPETQTGAVTAAYIAIKGQMVHVTISPSHSISTVNGYKLSKKSIVFRDSTTEEVNCPLFAFVIQDFGSKNRIHAIIITPLSGDTGRYRRIGMARIRPEDSVTREQILERPTEAIGPCDIYNPETGLHTIRIY